MWGGSFRAESHRHVLPGAGYSGQGCRCSLEEMTFPSLISSVMVRIWVLTWGAGPQGTAGAQAPVET